MHGEAALGTVRALAGDIGPRGTGTAAEAAARELVADRLSALGLTAERQPFRMVPSQNAFPLAIDALALVATAVYAVGTPAARWGGAAFGLSTAPLLWHTIRTSGRLLQPLLPRVASGNGWRPGPLRRRDRSAHEHARPLAPARRHPGRGLRRGAREGGDVPGGLPRIPGRGPRGSD